MGITRLDQLLAAAQQGPCLSMAVAAGEDAHTLQAVAQAVAQGLVKATVTGDRERILAVCATEGIDPKTFELVHEPVEAAAAARAVALVRNREAALLMKGSLSTDKYMRAILEREQGLLEPGGILSHVAVIEAPRHAKLLVCGDVAVIPQPDLKQKVAITRYVIATAKLLGIARPKVALVAASEQVLPGYVHTLEAAAIAKMAERGQILGAEVDGPMGLDAAIDPEAAQIKGLRGPVAGGADGLVFADIEGGNAFYKASTKLAGAELAAMVVGAQAPCVLSSRGDSVRTKLLSIALAVLAARMEGK